MKKHSLLAGVAAVALVTALGCASTPAKPDAAKPADATAKPADAAAKPGEGSCGADHKKAGEGSCGADHKGGEGSCGASKPK